MYAADDSEGMYLPVSSGPHMQSPMRVPDRSTSAPPILALQTESLFAFRAVEHARLFTDIRCDENYYDFYQRYDGGQGKLPPPLETLPFMALPGQHPGHPHAGPNPSPYSSHHPGTYQGHHHHHGMGDPHGDQHDPRFADPSYRLGGFLNNDAGGNPNSNNNNNNNAGRFALSNDTRNFNPLRVSPPQGFADMTTHHQPHSSHPHQHPHSHQHNPTSMHPQHTMQPTHSVRASYPPQDSSFAQGYDHLDEVPNGTSMPGSSLESIWTPLPRKMANLVLEDGDDAPHPTSGEPMRRRTPGPADVFSSGGGAGLVPDDGPIQSIWGQGNHQPLRYRSPPPIGTAPHGGMQHMPQQAYSGGSGFHPMQNKGADGSGFFAPSVEAPKVSPRALESAAMLHSPDVPSAHLTSPRHMSAPSLSVNTSPPRATSPPAQQQQQQGICRYYQQGYCSRGDKCNFKHPPEAEAAPAAEPVTSVLSAQDIIAQQKAAAVVAAAKQRKGLGLSPSPSPTAVPTSPDVTHHASPQKGHPGKGRPQRGAGMATSASNDSIALGKTDPLAGKQYTSFEQVQGQIYQLCKDQHGCRFLQKKLEEREPRVTEAIFEEVYDHTAELMVDPFGNYLCQKLLEHCNDEQRLMIIDKVNPDLVRISKNMHGTRAVQKMIEFLTTPEQIALIKKALANSVVPLIQDLNGNHVVQRCLNKLGPSDNQFIYDSVSQKGHCVEVATHRHGCCVLQRCIDHASDSQKMQLMNEIIANALVLVQDPYGNYVVQYVLDLPFSGIASRLARQFLGHVPILSTQKFSSNVIEKCLNVTDVPTRALLIQEIVEYDNLLYLLQDPYANYVIQTSLGMSEPHQHVKLVEAIRPHLAALRNTPYGKRIQNKILKESQREYYQ
eukprot:TRINITY_DN1670_c1_g1_i3.p1 TRINITY_DN1670_c1_g1~~TRINITY_DN1670_c1_g1_i3.p1  ORF type:complete len:963 (+),score=229.06 TRINITY_DN1670_c1_g1_i3:227-2890(+)